MGTKYVPEPIEIDIQHVIDSKKINFRIFSTTILTLESEEPIFPHQQATLNSRKTNTVQHS